MPLNTPTTPKLTEHQVLIIRDRVSMRDKMLADIEAEIEALKKEAREIKRAHCNKAIAADYGVEPGTVGKLINRETWKHI